MVISFFMEQKKIAEFIENLVNAVEKRLPEYLADEEDRGKNDGNSALCIIDASGGVHGKLFGSNKIRQRNSFRIAWTKASQVWITGMKTGEFETLVYSGKLDDNQFGIIRPDFIGWEGGQPVRLDAHTTISVGFSGFRGTSDLAIVQKAVADVLGGK